MDLTKYINKKQTLIALTLFVLSAGYGFLIRLNISYPIVGLKFQQFLQSHSHVAFLGWGYLATITALIFTFLTEKQRAHKTYRFSYLIMLLCVIGMLISFPLTGYKVFSITLLSVFGIISYLFSYRFLKDLSNRGIQSLPVKFVRYGIYYYLLSSLATWFLAYVLISQGKSSLYYNTVYFYLHFLYNGFFVFALFGLFFKLLEIKKKVFPIRHINHFIIYTNLACIPAYSLSILWSDVHVIFNVVGFLAGALQVISLVYLIRIFKQLFKKNLWSQTVNILLAVVLISYVFKIIIQLFSAIPYFVQQSLALKPFLIIGYLHLFTLGFMSVFILIILIELKGFSVKRRLSRIGLNIFLIGIGLTEFILFFQGFLIMLSVPPIQQFNMVTLVFSSILFSGLILFWLSQIQYTFRK